MLNCEPLFKSITQKKGKTNEMDSSRDYDMPSLLSSQHSIYLELKVASPSVMSIPLSFRCDMGHAVAWGFFERSGSFSNNREREGSVLKIFVICDLKTPTNPL
jgi:hypothetical protein